MYVAFALQAYDTIPLSLSLSVSLSLSLSLSLCLSLSLSYTHAHTHTPSLTHTPLAHTQVRTQFRKIFTQMGFEEMPTNQWVESSFWNFDTLFQPQQHPARDAHDTFFLTST